MSVDTRTERQLPDKTFFGHPRGLANLFGVEMWERFSSFRTQMVALNFLSIALGTATAGALAKYYDPANEGPYFAIVGGAAVLFGVLIALASPAIRRLMSGVH